MFDQDCHDLAEPRVYVRAHPGIHYVSRARGIKEGDVVFGRLGCAGHWISLRYLLARRLN
jgi:hypothetical protein